MEWLALLVLVPAILVPVAVLCGFVGCQYNPRPVGPPTPPDAPTALTALAQDRTSIEVTWQHADPSAVTFELDRLRGAAVELTTAATTPFTDMGLDPGVEYTYRVRALDEDNSANASAYAGPATARTLALAFDATGFPGAPSTDQALLAGRGICFVVRIEPGPWLVRGGSRVQIFVRGHSMPGFNLQLDRMRISQPALPSPPNPTPDPFDSHTDITAVFEGALTVMGGGGVVALPTISYALDHTKPLLVAFDINMAAANIQFRFPVLMTQVISYHKIPLNAGQVVAEAAQQDRTAPYSRNPSPTNDSIYLVEHIDAG